MVAVRPHRRERGRCGLCGRRSPGFDRGEGRRRWRALDLGTTIAHLEADAPRVRCPEHGVVVGAVPWARHDSRFTRAFEEQVAWLAVNTSASAVAELMRTSWRSVGAICERVAQEVGRDLDLLAGLRRIGIDEISHRKGHHGLLDLGRCRSTTTPGRRPRRPGEGQERQSRPSSRRSAPGAPTACGWSPATWRPGSRRCWTSAARRPSAASTPSIIELATEALDKVRREVWNEARRAGQADGARELKGARFALWKNPENLTARQQSKLADIEQAEPAALPGLPAEGAAAPDLPTSAQGRGRPAGSVACLGTRRRRLKPFVKLARTITAQRAGILAAIRHGLSNARVEAINTQIRLIARRAFGFHSPQALISLAMLKLGGLCPPLPGRVTVT